MTCDQVYRKLRFFDAATVADIADSLGVTSDSEKSSIHRALNIGVRRGLVVRVEERGQFTVYSLTDDGRMAIKSGLK